MGYRRLHCRTKCIVQLGGGTHLFLLVRQDSLMKVARADIYADRGLFQVQCLNVICLIGEQSLGGQWLHCHGLISYCLHLRIDVRVRHGCRYSVLAICWI